MNPAFFPPQTWEMYFNKKLKTGPSCLLTLIFRLALGHLPSASAWSVVAKRTKVKKRADQLVGGEEQGEDQEEKVSCGHVALRVIRGY